ncbi:hypothetical protein AN958_12014 [Leucoagaricus sp. SymC.cos]|nr:hypothetical protein AN958_12014 [Leucoagaricus sp. SymC.cos]
MNAPVDEDEESDDYYDPGGKVLRGFTFLGNGAGNGWIFSQITGVVTSVGNQRSMLSAVDAVQHTYQSCAGDMGPGARVLPLLNGISAVSASHGSQGRLDHVHGYITEDEGKTHRHGALSKSSIAPPLLAPIRTCPDFRSIVDRLPSSNLGSNMAVVSSTNSPCHFYRTGRIQGSQNTNHCLPSGPSLLS